MLEVRHISDLQNNLGEIYKIVCDLDKPLCLTSEEQSDMVLISMESFSKLQYNQEIKHNLLIAEKEERTTDLRYSVEEVRNSVKQAIQGAT